MKNTQAINPKPQAPFSLDKQFIKEKTMKTNRVWSLVIVVLTVVLASCQTSVVPKFSEGELDVPLIPTFNQTELSTQDISTGEFDVGNGLAIKGANLYVVGYTEGSLDGDNLGSNDAFLRRYDGGKLWGEQFGGRGGDVANAVATDSSGNVYVFGHTNSAMGFKIGGLDNYLVKYTKQGQRLWVRQFGTSGSDVSKDVVIDSNNRIYTLSDEGSNNFTLRKFNTSGTLLDSKSVTQNNRPGLTPEALAVDSLNNLIVLTEWNNGSKGFDIRLYKYSSNLNQVWQKAQSSSDNDFAYDITTDSTNNIYFSYHRDTNGKGGYFQKRDANGSSLFTKRLEPAPGTANTFPQTITTASNGHIYIAGYTMGAFSSYTNAGSGDIVVFRYSPNGNRQWVTQFAHNNYGSPDLERANDIVVNGYVYITGYTHGNLLTGSATSYGFDDAYIAMLSKSNGDILGIDQ